MSQHRVHGPAEDSTTEAAPAGLIALTPIGADAPGCEGDSCLI